MIKRTLILVLCCLVIPFAKAQQNHSLFLWHDVQESNLLNPAVPVSCKWYIGIPVLSSVHLNYANSSFTFNQLFTNTANGVSNPDLNGVNERMHFRNFIGTEVHTQLLALGYRHNEYSFMFTITEKNNFPLTYPKDLVNLLLQGNGGYIGSEVSFRGTGIYFNHYREYAIGVSKSLNNKLRVGAKAKLLFGKLNVSTRKTNVNLHTDETTFNLGFDGEVLINTSLPLNVDISNNTVNSIGLSSNFDPVGLALNRKNPGFAIDAGVIYDYTSKIQLSASLIDFGFIRWRSNLNTFDGKGEFSYTGIFNQNDEDGGYFTNVQEQFFEQMELKAYQAKYTTFLPPRIMAAANYKHNRYFSAGVLTNVIIHKSKTMPSLTLTGQAKPFYWLGFVGSYTLQNYAFNNLGFGFFIGKNPVQFYMVSDNALAFVKPFDARMINLRFGININLGCKKEDNESSQSGYGGGGCFGMNKALQKKYLKKVKPWSKRKSK